ncbi:hypothetical protein BDV32DRAFT_114895 [Aspergillus pseudonomiae]|uniref:Uncharacterized protein n=1 Tax=Aspergillus pseudonomiae TaxID=1506151 RepID=A0A5N7D2B8_9EURO|nr:uncharacterized protein BDV37DRAFT_257464 [Aspergillus pseudonomiae]KAB8265976.1 hypothetical protein BDV32DRAFT_114895 [Aspergillus pseudonomiae]KAE8400562.1 hypothetical protein BDV37DRAFT_257464 [Aspergillus pseudonomiae]
MFSGNKCQLYRRLQYARVTVVNLQILWRPPIQAYLKHSFFNESDSITLDTRIPIAGSYKYLSELGDRGEKDTWRARFLMVIFYRLLKATGGKKKQVASVNRTVALLVNSGIVNDSREQVSLHCDTWGKIGRRLELLCKELQGVGAQDEDESDEESNTVGGCSQHNTRREYLGFLFRLPLDMSNDCLRKIPLSGEKRAPKVQRLRDRGLYPDPKYDAVNDLASDIFNYLWECIRKSLMREDFLLYKEPKRRSQIPPHTKGTNNSSSRDSGVYSMPLQPPGHVTYIGSTTRGMEVSHGNAQDTATYTTLISGEVSEPAYIATQTEHSVSDQQPNEVQPLLPQPEHNTLPGSNNCSERSETETESRNVNPRPYLHYTPNHPLTQQSDTLPAQHPIQEPPIVSQSNNQFEPQMDVSPGGFNPRPYLHYTPSYPFTQQSDILPAQHSIHEPRIVPQSDNQYEPDQMDMSPSGFNPRPYLHYTPSHPFTQQSDILPTQRPIQEPHIVPQSNNQFEPDQMDVTPREFDPRPYLHYTPTSEVLDNPFYQQSDTIPATTIHHLFLQHPHMALSRSNSQGIPPQVDTIPGQFNPRPYLYYTPISVSDQTSQQNSESNQVTFDQQTYLSTSGQSSHPHITQIDTACGRTPKTGTNHSFEHEHHDANSTQGWKEQYRLGPGCTETRPDALNGLNRRGNHVSSSQSIVIVA